jgi:ATPase family associated with various cellular activities (AAA)
MFNKIRNLFQDETEATDLETTTTPRPMRENASVREIPSANTEGPSAASGEASGLDGNLQAAFLYLQGYISARLDNYFDASKALDLPRTPQYNGSETSAFTTFIKQRQPDDVQLIAVLLGLVPQVYPNFLDALVQQALPKGMTDFMEFGGLRGTQHRGVLPTGETLLFVLAGNDFELRLNLVKRIRHDSFFNQEHIVSIEAPKSGEPLMSGRLALEGELTEWLLTDTLAMPKLSMEFPAQHIHTELEWSDLVLDNRTASQIDEIKHWLEHSHTLLFDWGMHKKVKPGYRALFYGPPGTGKTLTATLLGKFSGMDVFRIDLSMVVSKYIGETEKNLSNLFERAENKNWILFFDEADALFGKRTGVRDAHDKYANQEVAYLLQRIENYPGLVILASNFRSNIDEAFMRRFQSAIYFPTPKPAERLLLWQKLMPPQMGLAANVDLTKVAYEHDLTGSNIINIIQHCALNVLSQNQTELSQSVLNDGIIREKIKISGA